jgi:Peptidase family M23/Transglycosylase-like domain
VKTLSGAGVALITLICAIVVVASGNAPSYACQSAGPLAVVLATIRELESSGNYQAQSAGSTASGAYQFLDSTWAGFGGYPRAVAAPASVQDARATQDVNNILAAHNGDVAAIPPVWYVGVVYPVGDPRWDQIPWPSAGNTITPRQYQTRWLNIYQRLLNTTPGATTATPTTSGGTPATAPVPVTSGCAPTSVDGYALPVERSNIAQYPGDLSLPHHNYPALDWPTAAGTPVYAVATGIATRVTNEPRNCYPDASSCNDICGLGINITDSRGMNWVYCHASQLFITQGATVTAGQHIMDSGNTGHSSGPHLHFGIRGPNGVDYCPQPLLAALYATNRGIDPFTLPTTGCTVG